MRLRYFGGFSLDTPEVTSAGALVRGRGQEALLFRLSLDPGSTVRYRALAEDVWPDDQPEDPRSALHSLASRLRRALPPGIVEAVAGGYRLALGRAQVDVVAFQDLVAAARRATEPAEAAGLARSALDLWVGEPWTPSDGFDWVVRDLYEDRGHAERLLAATPVAPRTPIAPASVESAAVETAAVPAALTYLVGRRHELDVLAEQLTTNRLVTLIGPGGAGKTTLAMETARRIAGSVVVELAPTSGEEVWEAVVGALGRSIRVTEASAGPSGARERALLALAGRSPLIVLDNCEHVSAHAAAVAIDLMQAVPAARLLATSREPLGVPGEAFVDLVPLPTDDAVELFTRRVTAARGLAPEEADSEAVERITRRLDGLPLALELAASKSRTLTLAEIEVGLDDRFTLLARGPQGADPRHQTLRALIDWSWETLTGPERTALLCAAVFPDGLGTGDASAVATAFDTDAEAFDQLVDRSLMHRSRGRYRMLETVREYGLDRLRAQGMASDYRARECHAIGALAAAQDVRLRGPQVREALAWFDVNEENLGLGLRTAAHDADLRGAGLRLVRSTLWAWMMRDRFEDVQAALVAYHTPDAALDSEAAVVVNGLGSLADAVRTALVARDDPADLDDLDEGGGVDRVAAAGRGPAGFAGQVAALTDAAARYPSELTAALPPLLAAAAAALQAPQTTSIWSRSFQVQVQDPPDAPPWTRAILALIRAAIAQNSGDIATLGEQSERALRMFTGLQDPWGVAMSSQWRAEWLTIDGELEQALAVSDTGVASLTGLTSVADQLQHRLQGLNLLVRLGRTEQARARVAEVLSLAGTDSSERAVAQASLSAAGFFVAQGEVREALEHLARIPVDSPLVIDQIQSAADGLRARALIIGGDLQEAREVAARCARIALRSGDQPIIAEAMLTLALWFAGTDDTGSARRALATSRRIRGAVDRSDPVQVRLVQVVGDPKAEEGDDDAGPLVALLG